MLELLLSILSIFITIFFVIGTHEAAHFFVARLLGVKVLRFSIGFGKVIFRWFDKKQTEYVISLIPLGGYVKMLDETEESVPENELPYAFNRQPFYKKFLIVLAGPLSNLFSAVILYWFMFIIGFFIIRPIIGNVTPQSIADLGGLKSQQEIVNVDHHETLAWTSILFRIIAHTGNNDQLYLTTKNVATNQSINHTLNLTNWKMNDLSPDPLQSLGITPYEPEIPLVVGKIEQNSPAALSQLKIGDKIIATNQKPVTNWIDLVTFINKNPNKSVLFSVKREGKQIDIPVMIGAKHYIYFKRYGFLGIGPHFDIPKNILRKIKYGPIESFTHAFQQVWDLSYLNMLLLAKMITGKLSVYSLGGPITIFESAGTALNSGFLSFLGFLAFLSVSIGIINLLPIPGLDGGHLLFQIIEFITQRQIPERWMLLFYRLGFLFILLILIHAVLNDLLRL